jgi:hypothetical protein
LPPLSKAKIRRKNLMDENNNVVNPTTTTQTATPPVDKTFTQKDVDEIVITRLSKERAKIYKQLGIEDESKVEDYKIRVSGYDTLKQEHEALKIEVAKSRKVNALQGLNADDDFTDYLLGKIQGDGDEFIANAKKFLEANPKFKKDTYRQVNASVDVNNGNAYPELDKMTTEQYLAWRAKNKL